MNTDQLTIPSTPKCRVVYIKEGVNYGAVINTNVLSAWRKFHSAAILVRVEPLQPLPSMERPHPAAHRLAKYATVAER